MFTVKYLLPEGYEIGWGNGPLDPNEWIDGRWSAYLDSDEYLQLSFDFEFFTEIKCSAPPHCQVSNGNLIVSMGADRHLFPLLFPVPLRASLVFDAGDWKTWKYQEFYQVDYQGKICFDWFYSDLEGVKIEYDSHLLTITVLQETILIDGKTQTVSL